MTPQLALLERKIKDRRALKLIRKYLKAGVMEGGVWTKSRKGTPQGGLDSPYTIDNFSLDISISIRNHSLYALGRKSRL